MRAPCAQHGHLPRRARTEPKYCRLHGAAHGLDHVAQEAAGRRDRATHRVQIMSGEGGSQPGRLGVDPGTPQPAPHGRGRELEVASDAAVPGAPSGGQQGHADGLRAVGSPWVAGHMEQHLGASAAPAPAPPGVVRHQPGGGDPPDPDTGIAPRTQDATAGPVRG